MENQNNKNNESSSFFQWGLLGLLAYGVIRYFDYLETDSVIENPEPETDEESVKPKKTEEVKEPETVKKYAEEIDDDITMKVREAKEHEKGNWLAILCRADGQESDKCFFADTKKEAIEKAFQDELSCYEDVIEK